MDSVGWVELIVVSFYSRHIYPLSQKAQDYPGLKRTRLNFKIRIDLFSLVVTWFEMGKQQFKMADA